MGAVKTATREVLLLVGAMCREHEGATCKF